jgi:dUTP pyrophosphatase
MPGGEEDAAERFYAGVLGLERVPKPKAMKGRGGCWFRGEGIEVHLGVEEPFSPARKAHPAFLVRDLGSLRTRLERDGIQVEEDVQLSGQRRIHTFDPFGNRLEFVEIEREDAGSRELRLPFRRLDSEASLPSFARPGDAGLDLASAIDLEVSPGGRALVPTGIAVAIPVGYAGLVLPRSGLASRAGLTMANSPGLIDSGYRGEVTCAVVNLDRAKPVRIERGDRIAQLVIVPIPVVRPEWAGELPPSERGPGGFGSTGV